MARLGGLLVLLVCGGLLLACQGDHNIPSEPGRGLDLTAGACKNAVFTSAAAIYTNSTVQNGKLQACKDILNLVKQNNVGQAETRIDDLLVAIHGDYHNGTAALAGVAPQTLEQSVATYISAACGLAPLSASECLVPKDLDDTPDGIDADDLDGWLASGPLASSGTSLATGVLPNGIFAFGVEAANATYVFVSERPRTGVDGPCPQNFANDCQDDVFDIDVDGGFTSVAIESCAVFGEKHIRCPDGGDCEVGETATPLNLVTDAACTAAGYTMMGFWGQFAFQATRPAQWLIHATPAYAGVTTKFGAFSPIVLADGDPRQRGVVCNVTANFPSGAEGSVCRILDHGTQIASCATVATGAYTSSCSMAPLVPEDLSLVGTAEKTGGGGTYNASQNFSLGPANPPRGGSTTLEFQLLPRGKKKN